MLAKSKAGHDAGRVYVVLQQTQDPLGLVDGVSRTIHHPKKKKRMHVQPIIHLPEEILAVVRDETELTDEMAVKILDLYSRRK
jgi:ribosomal protein L14E/L6E/L27E